MAPRYSKPIRIVHRGGKTLKVTWGSWYGEDKGTLRASCWLHLGPGQGLGLFSLSHGWGAKELNDWHIHEDDRDALLAWAEKECERRISKMPRSPGRPRGKRVPKADPRQMGLPGLGGA